MADVEKIYRKPLGVTADDSNNEVRVCVVLPGLTKKTIGNKSQPKNGHVEVDFQTRSLDVRVELITKQKTTENYRYTVKKLPNDVVPERCRYTVDKDKLVLHLHKAEAQSWAAQLDQSGLETDRPQDGDDE